MTLTRAISLLVPMLFGVLAAGAAGHFISRGRYATAGVWIFVAAYELVVLIGLSHVGTP